MSKALTELAQSEGIQKNFGTVYSHTQFDLRLTKYSLKKPLFVESVYIFAKNIF